MERVNTLAEKLKTFFQTNFTLAIIMLIGSFILVFVLGFLIGRLIESVKSSKKIKAQRKDALKKSRAILRGQIYEELAPYFPNFPVNPQSLKFLGSPVDYIAFVGKSGNPEFIDEIVFIEIKTGESALTTREKSIQKAITEKKVRFIEYYL